MLRLEIRVDRDRAELVLAELLELAPCGVEETAIDEHTIGYAVYGAPGELPLLPELEAVVGTALVTVTSTEIADDWADRWREFHKPLVIAGQGLRPALCVRPPWEPVSEARHDIVIDPGQAFGTGAHATTALCLELLLDTDPAARGSLVDLGCGSGVLAILAARLGFGPVLALDYDPLAVQATQDNASRNNVVLEIRRFDLREQQVPDAGLVVANVLAPPLLHWAGAQQALPTRLILSGLLASEADQIARAYARRGLTETERRVSGDWAALSLAR